MKPETLNNTGPLFELFLPQNSLYFIFSFKTLHAVANNIHTRILKQRTRLEIIIIFIFFFIFF